MQVELTLGQGLTQTDVIVLLNWLVINSPTSSTTNESACDSYTWNGVIIMQVVLILGQVLIQTM